MAPVVSQIVENAVGTAVIGVGASDCQIAGMPLPCDTKHCPAEPAELLIESGDEPVRAKLVAVAVPRELVVAETEVNTPVDGAALPIGVALRLRN